MCRGSRKLSPDLNVTCRCERHAERACCINVGAPLLALRAQSSIPSPYPLTLPPSCPAARRLFPFGSIRPAP